MHRPAATAAFALLVAALFCAAAAGPQSSRQGQNADSAPTAVVLADYIVGFRDKDTAEAAGVASGRARGAAIERGRDALMARLKAAIVDTFAGRGADQFKVLRTYTHAFPGFVASMTREMAEAAARQPYVAFAEADSEVRTCGGFTYSWQAGTATLQSDALPWGLDRIDQRSAARDGAFSFRDRVPTVFVLDTGVQATHAEFQGPFGPRAFAGPDYVADINGAPGGTDCNGHGTHVAGTIAGSTYGVAKRANVVAVKVLDCAGSGTVKGVVAGIDYVGQQAAASDRALVLSLSLAAPLSTALNRAVSGAADGYGVLAVVAAGNANASACGYSPASVASACALTVAARRAPRLCFVRVTGRSTEDDARAHFSNWGQCVRIFAPGTNVKSSYIGPSNAETRVMSGTSMAAPHVSGAAALALLADPTLPCGPLAASLLAAATAAVPDDLGAGSPTSLLYVDPTGAATATLGIQSYAAGAGAEGFEAPSGVGDAGANFATLVAAVVGATLGSALACAVIFVGIVLSRRNKCRGPPQLPAQPSASVLQV